MTRSENTCQHLRQRSIDHEIHQSLTHFLVVAVVVWAPAAHSGENKQIAKERPKLRLCTAQAGNNYYRAGELIADAVNHSIDVRVIENERPWENLETMSASQPRCDAIVAQDDAVALHRFQNEESKLAMMRLTTLFEEKVHVLCNRKVKADSLKEIEPGTIAMLINEYGSGSYISWRVMSKLNQRYRQFGASEKSLRRGTADATRQPKTYLLILCEQARRQDAESSQSKLWRPFKAHQF